MPKNTPERIIDSRTTPSGVVVAYGGAGGWSGALPAHNSLPGLTVGDPHTQYLNTERANALYVPLSRQIQAGDGLAGGGALSVNRTLSLASSVAGDGLAFASGVLSVNVAGLGLSVGADTVTLTSSSNPGENARILASTEAGGLTLQSLAIGAAISLLKGGDVSVGPDIQLTSSGLIAVEANLYINLDSDNTSTNAALIIERDANTSAGVEVFRFSEDGTATITGKVRTPLIDAANILTIQPVGDLVLDPGGSDVLPGGSIEDDLGDYNRKWRTLFAAELYVETLVAQDVLSTIGGRIEVTPTTTLIADLSAAAATMDVKHNNLRQFEWAYLMAAPGGVAQFEVIRVNSAATPITGGFRYTILRDRSGSPVGSAPDSWVAGDAVASLGKNAGEGHISLTSTTTVYNHLGPTIAIYSRNAATSWNAVQPTVAMGDLESFVDYSASTMGLAIGNDLTKTPITGFKGLTADATDGLRMFSTAISMFNGATQTFYLAPTGLEMWMGPSSADKRVTWDGTTYGVVGNVVATAGYIGGAGGWSITTGQLISNNIALVSGNSYTARIELGDGTPSRVAGIRAGGAATAGDTAFWAASGHEDTINAKWRVTFGGTQYSKDAVFGNSLYVDAAGAYVPAPSSFSLDYGYKFRYGGVNAAGLIGRYTVGSRADLYLLNNMLTTTNSIMDANADSYLTIMGAAGSAKVSQVGIYAKRVVGGVDTYTGLTIINSVANQSISYVTPSTTYKLWHEGNDGTGSGLDADLLDGLNSDVFARLNAVNNTFSNQNTFNGDTILAGAVNCGGYVRFAPFSTPPDFQSGYAVLFLLNAGSNNYQFRVKIRTPDGTRTVNALIGET